MRKYEPPTTNKQWDKLELQNFRRLVVRGKETLICTKHSFTWLVSSLDWGSFEMGSKQKNNPQAGNLYREHSKPLPFSLLAIGGFIKQAFYVNATLFLTKLTTTDLSSFDNPMK